MNAELEIPNRRPLKSRSHPLAQRTAAWLAQHGASPNGISLLSIGFAAAGAAGLLLSPNVWGLAACALFIQLRLVCNLLDGMVAVEGGRKTPVGALYNELPDRVADSLLIVALGYAVGQPWLGWFGALAAALTAYIRTLGGALGQEQDFRGPMAKQQRMATLTVACLVGAVEIGLTGTRFSLLLGAWIVALGSVLTCVTRSRAIAARLNTLP
jgi:phosphatidylglycerophosphate synthase